MKLVIFMMFSSCFLFALNPMTLPIKGVHVVHSYSNGEKENITISREEYPECQEYGITAENFQSGDLASPKVPAECKKTFFVTKGMIHPLNLEEGIKTVGELEVLEFIQEKSSKEPEKYILVDSRKSEWFNYGTIPSSINIPYDELKYDEDFQAEYKRAYNLLGVKILGKDKYDFTNAKTAILFCNGSWCGQSPMAIDELVKIGYPKEKIMWYRGGIAAWAGVSLTMTKNIEAK